MDILKILSRGTKKSAAQNVPVVAKPIQKQANPQLYNDPTRGTKRKRTEHPLPELAASDAEDDVDFFAPKGLNKATSREDNDSAEKESAAKQTPDLPAPLDDDEVRQILRSHRLKFTLLSSHEEEKSKVKKSKKKQKTAPTTKPSKDSKARALYPQPLTSFTELRSTYNVSARVCSNLAKQGFRLPTEVQLASLPLLLSPERALVSSASDLDYNNGIDFLAVAPTGSGKTLTFLIPSINDVLKRRSEGTDKADGPSAVIIAPTRELAHQIANEGKKLAQGTGVKIVSMKKGMAIPAEGGSAEEVDVEEEEDKEDGSDESEAESDENTKEPKKPTITKADILVTTPMMLLNFLTKGSKSRKLPSVKSLILDEADVLLDPLFRDQTMGIWNACSSPSLRVTLWSATMGANIESLVAEQLKPRTSAPLIRLVVGLKDTAVPSIKHKLIYTATEQGKLFALRQLLHPNQSSSKPSNPSQAQSANTIPDMRLPFLIFTQTIDRATALHNELKFDIPIEAGGSTRIAVLHSSMPDHLRSSCISRFRAGEIWVLITTDLLMRGIDFHGVNGVINYDVPTSAAAYIHRVGRTGRAGHEGCVAVTLYTNDDVPGLKTIANVISLSEKQASSKSDETTESAVPKWLMDSLPKVGKESKKKLRQHGVESRRSNFHSKDVDGGKELKGKAGGGPSRITSKSAWERRKEHNKRGAIEGSRQRKKVAEAEAAAGGGEKMDEGEFGGFDD